MKRRHEHALLIEALGSQTLRRRFNITRGCLHNWRHRGIPLRFRPAVAELAAIWEVQLPNEFLKEFPGAVIPAPADG